MTTVAAQAQQKLRYRVLRRNVWMGNLRASSDMCHISLFCAALVYLNQILCCTVL